jgi:hypothetical protein
MIKNMILDINSDYKFAFDNGVIPNDILVATV